MDGYQRLKHGKAPQGSNVRNRTSLTSSSKQLAYVHRSNPRTPAKSRSANGSGARIAGAYEAVELLGYRISKILLYVRYFNKQASILSGNVFGLASIEGL